MALSKTDFQDTSFTVLTALFLVLVVLYHNYWLSLAIVIGTVVVIILCDVQRNRQIEEQTFYWSLRHYLMFRFLAILGYIMMQKLEKHTREIVKVQERTLFSVLRKNQDTEYGKRFNFSSMNSVADFLKMHPLTKYNHFESYTQRMLNGEANVLTAEEPSMFCVTSGTSGKSKIIATVRRQSKVFLIYGVSILLYCMIQFRPQTKLIRKSMKFFYDPEWQKSKTGILVGPGSSTPTQARSFLNIYSTPSTAFKILSEQTLLYIHLLFGLSDRHLGMLEANFASMVYCGFKMMELQWESLMDDIKNGRVNSSLDIKDSIRKELDSLLKPNPCRVAELREAYRKGIVGLIKRIWPRLEIVLCVDSGSFKIYARKLRQTYLKGIPLYSPVYAASEGLLGINIWPGDMPSRYLLVPDSQFFEFIPLACCDEDQPETLQLHQVKQGEEYEMVLTNPSCLFRYRFGDVVKVVHFHNQCPVVEFMYRQLQYLNVRGEKVTEATFYKVLLDTVEQWPGIELIDYCCAESIIMEDIGTDFEQSCYHVFLELEEDGDKNKESAIPSVNTELLDETLRAQSARYSTFRKLGSIGPMKIHLVKPGSFYELRINLIQNTLASSVQFKVPRVLRSEAVARFMMERILA